MAVMSRSMSASRDCFPNCDFAFQIRTELHLNGLQRMRGGLIEARQTLFHRGLVRSTRSVANHSQLQAVSRRSIPLP